MGLDFIIALTGLTVSCRCVGEGCLLVANTKGEKSDR